MEAKLNGWIIFFIVLAAIGAINWGLIGVFNWNLVDAVLGGGAQETTSAPSRFVYTVIGLGGVAAIIGLVSMVPGSRPGRFGRSNVAARP
jgi:uncharacterized membrane protein YuzA (DUF378 family)